MPLKSSRQIFILEIQSICDAEDKKVSGNNFFRFVIVDVAAHCQCTMCVQNYTLHSCKQDSLAGRTVLSSILLMLPDKLDVCVTLSRCGNRYVYNCHNTNTNRNRVSGAVCIGYKIAFDLKNHGYTFLNTKWLTQLSNWSHSICTHEWISFFPQIYSGWEYFVWYFISL